MKWSMIFFGFVGIAASCADTNKPTQNTKVLFVGNSLSYFNDMPLSIEGMAAEVDLEIETSCLCKPSYALIDHWADGEIQHLLSSEEFDYVVMQQGPSSQPYGRELLIEYVGTIGGLARENGAQPVVYMVWPSIQYYQTFDGVIESHMLAAEQNGALLSPVGIAWRHLHEEKTDAGLYSIDNFHPTAKGSQLAAAIILQTLVPEVSLFDILEDWQTDEIDLIRQALESH